MPITERQREERLNAEYIGCSSLPAILGVNPWRTTYDEYLILTGQAVVEPNDRMDLGNNCEDIPLRYAEARLGPIRRNVFRRHPDIPLGCHLDAVVQSNKRAIEAKMSSLSDEWGEEDSADVPVYVAAQVQGHLLVTGDPEEYVSALLLERWRPRQSLYTLPARPDIQERIAEVVAEFHRCVKTLTPPKERKASIDLVKKLARIPDKVISIPDSVVTRWRRIRAAKAKVAKLDEEATGELVAYLEDAEAGECSLGTVTYYKQSQKRLDTDALKTALPGVYAEYSRTIEFRVARLSAPKQEKKSNGKRNNITGKTKA